MKKIVVFILLVPFYFFSQSGSKKRSALFIGNSYTYFNNLPQLVEQLAMAAGDTLIVDTYAPGGYTFNNHFNDLNTKAKIYSKDWDFVILQAQSQEPSFSPAQVNAQTFPYALKLDSLIKDNYACSKTIFYETWGRKFGDASNCAAYPPVCTYTGMQNRLKQSYKLFANSTNGIMAPAGEAFRASILQNPNLDLYQSDQSHPSLEGSYLTASVFYETIFQKSVLSNTFISSVNSATASFLQQIAHEVIRDSLAIWNIGTSLAWADFTYTNTGNSSYQFQSYSTVLANTWYFGDGTSANTAQVNHQYSTSGNYLVRHVVNDNCLTDSVWALISVSIPLNLNKYESTKQLSLYPNPSSSYIKNTLSPAGIVRIYSTGGVFIKEMPNSEDIYVGDLADGLYFIQLQDQQDVFNLHFLKISQ